MPKHQIATILALFLLAAAALAADAPKDAPKETLEATATRVRELEKANVVLQEDLARARLQLDLTREALGKARTDLDSEVAARKALEGRLADAQQQTARDISSSTKSVTDTLEPRLAELEKSLQALSARQQADMAAMKQQYEARVAALQQALDTETAARQDFQKSTVQQVNKLESTQKRDRTWSWAVNGINLGIGLFKK